MTSSSECIDLDVVKANVFCPKCKSLFKEPKLLPCLHCVCVGCLSMEKGVRKHEGLRYLVVCPVCREERELSKTGLSSLPDAHFKRTMVKVYRLLEGRGGRCEECKTTELEPGTIKSVCDQCGFICDSCVESHKRLRAYVEHKTISLKDGGKFDLSEFLHPVAESCNLTCARHTGEPLKMYCKTCKRLVCRECTLSQHKLPQHHCDLISSVVARQKDEVKQCVSSVEELHSEMIAIVEEVQSSKESINRERDIAKSTISTSIDELMRKLDQLKSKLLLSVDKETEQQILRLTSVQMQAEKRASEIRELVNTTDECFKYSTDQEFMSVKYYLQTRVKEEAQRKDKRFSSAQAVLDLPFSCTERMKELCISHLELCHTFSAEKSSLSGQGLQHAEVGKLSRFVVHTRTRSGHVCLEKQLVEVSIIMPRSGETLDPVVTMGTELGTYEVCYEPTNKGQYKIIVKAGGEDVGRAPFFVTVKPSKLECTTPILVCDKQEWPWGVACSTKREIYITRNFHHLVMVLDKDGHSLRSFGIKGQKAGQFWKPTGIAVDRDGSVYVADGEDNGRVQKFNSQGQFEAMYPKLSHPHGVMVNRHGDKVYVCDKHHSCIVVLDNQLQLIKTFGELLHHSSHDGYENISGHLLAPHSIAEDKDGLIYVTDIQDGIGCVHVFTANGEHCKTFTRPHTDMFMPLGVCVEDDYVYVCDGAENCLVVFRRSGEFVTTCGSYGKQRGQFHSPLSVAVDLDGFLYVCDHNNARVQVF